MIGEQLGHYEITAELGRGGMGEVYRARDTKLGREVAIKVLPAEFARDDERVARLEREARMLAALNHPNIAAIYGLEQSGDTRFLVLELVEGETLAERMRGRAIQPEESLRLALQIAQALEAAHEKSVIHRDLKPANIKITPEGRVKVLDFGLAKALIGEQADVNLSNSPTLSMAATQAGIILGTAAYMSPEQASGEVADHRTDVWAFGVVVFEMLTGQPLFTGKTASHIMGAVLNIDPDWDRLPPNLHPRVRGLLERCLEKEAKDRLSGISDARVELQKILADPSGVVVQPQTPTAAAAPGSRRAWLAAVVLVGALAGAGAWLLKPVPLPEVVRLEHALPDGLALRNPSSIAVSPDGRMVAYDTLAGLYLLSVDQFDARLVPGTEDGALLPVFSPDGEWLAFSVPGEGEIRKVPVGGGAPVVVGVGGTIVGMTWGDDNRLVIGAGAPARVLAVSGDGGTPEPIFAPDAAAAAFGWPQVLPDGDSLLFTIVPGPEVGLKRAGSDEVEVLFRGGNARYLPTGHIVYWFDGALYAQRFDADALETVGGPVPMVEGVANFPYYRVSDSGTLAWFAGTVAASATERALVWVDREGNEEAIGAEARGYEYLSISHDGRRVAVDEANQAGDIWVWNFQSQNAVRLTTGEGSELYPVWTSDDSRIAFAAVTGGGRIISSKASSNTGTIEALTGELGAGAQGVTPYFFTPDDEALVFREQLHPETLDNIGMIALDGSSEPAWLLASEFNERNAVLSPDGNWMAYQSDESGRFEVYVRPFPNVEDDLWTISTAGGVKPLWGPDGAELFFLQPGASQQMMVARVETGTTFNHALPEPLIPWPYDLGREGRTFDIAPDGQRFLTTKAADTGDTADDAPTPEPAVRIVLNWLEELNERAPAQ